MKSADSFLRWSTTSKFFIRFPKQTNKKNSKLKVNNLFNLAFHVITIY